MGQFILVVMVGFHMMGGESESWTKLWHVYDNEVQCKTAALNLTFIKKSGNKGDFITIKSDAVCERFNPEKHQNLYRGVK